MTANNSKDLLPKAGIALFTKRPNAESIVEPELEEYDVAKFRRPTSSAFMSSCSNDQAMTALHHRLHLSPSILQSLGERTKDAPRDITRAQNSSCSHCVEANATRLQHSSTDVYQPSHVGRLIHSDIVGPFKASTIGHYQYALILIDDHSRFKHVYFLKKKSDALARVREYTAALRALMAKSGSDLKVGTLHTDNAGEYLSHEFEEFLDSESIEHTTCPPHVHQLNGVAERAIRSIVENAKAHLTASNCSIGYWNYAFMHSVDILNRTTGPPESKITAYEAVTGKQPKVLPIMPFGCRAIPVQPRSAIRKTFLYSTTEACSV